jgi:hypothetical protein
MGKNMTRRITEGKNDKSIQGFQGYKELKNWLFEFVWKMCIFVAKMLTDAPEGL